MLVSRENRAKKITQNVHQVVLNAVLVLHGGTHRVGVVVVQPQCWCPGLGAARAVDIGFVSVGDESHDSWP